MEYVIVIFGTLIALNWGVGYWLSEENKDANRQGVVEVEAVPVADVSVPQNNTNDESQGSDTAR